MTRVTDLFIKLASIPSPSGKEQKIAEYISSYLQKLGYRVTKDKKGNLIITTQSLNKKGPTLLFCAHLDTVPPADKVTPIIKKGYIYSDGSSVLGADDKSGVAAILEMLQRIKKDKVLYNQIKVIFTVEEEIDLLGSKSLTKEVVKADMGFVLDADGDVGMVVNKAPFLNSFIIDIKGKAAHAGLAPEEGVNAIRIAAEAITNLPDGRIDKETTINIGQINGGTAQNIVPEQVQIIAEIRSHKENKLKKNTELVINTFEKISKKYQGKATIETKRAFNGLDIPRNHQIIELVKKAAKTNNLKFKVETCGGGSDAQIINNLGVPTVVLATGMENVHSTRERIKIKNLEDLAELLITIVKIANGRQ